MTAPRAAHRQGSIHCEVCDRILGAIPSSVLVVSRTLRVLAVNPNFLLKSRRRLEETLGRPLADVFPSVILETVIGRQVAAALRGQTSAGERITFRAPGLDERTYFARVAPFAGDEPLARPEAAVVILDDVTMQDRLGNEVRRAEHKLARIVGWASDIIASLDAEGRITSWNRAGETLLRVAEGDVLGRALQDLLCDHDRDAYRTTLALALAGGRPPAVELSLAGQGGLVPVSWRFSHCTAGEWDRAQVVAVGRDLTDIRRLEERLHETEKLISLGVMAGGIAHELRNPLAVVSSAAELLLDRPRDLAMTRACLERIVAASARAARVIEALLRFARPVRVEDWRRLDLHALVAEAAAAFEARQPRPRVVAGAGPLEVDGSPELLGIALTNLLANAVEATPPAGAVTLHAERDDGGAAVVRVADTGHGVAAEDLKRVFDPFFTTKPPGGGLGLGLSITHSIVRAHGGSIAVTSLPGRGTTFTLSLPSAPVTP